MPPPETGAHLHLDPIGGVAGDMILAALLDARPDLEGRLAEALRLIGLPGRISVGRVEGEDRHFRGSRLRIEGIEEVAPPGHTARELLDRIAGSSLPGAVRDRAHDMLLRLSRAEARVHGIPVEEVHFHEIASWDTLIDLVGAATLVEAMGVIGVSVAPLPLGRGRVASDHGALPVPAPATAELLMGLEIVDDGVPGERVTPTGAAILAHLQPAAQMPRAGRLRHVGVGLGTRRMRDIANMLRVLVLSADGASAREDVVGVIRFEVDDQTGEELAVALDALRAGEGVLDVCCWPAFGKKGRIATAVQVLCEPQAMVGVSVACLLQTSTIGLRRAIERRTVLPRESLRADTEAGPVAVKRVERPGGIMTLKAEANDLAALGEDLVTRRRLRRQAEEGR
jgi:uncharacterized protein (TIGR00299 family) protein